MARRIAVLGAGAVGGSIGAYLTREGHEVTLVDQWAAHVEKIRHDGLTVTDLSGEFKVPAKAFHLSEVGSIRERFDIVYLSVKSYDTRWSTYLIEPLLKPTGFILPAQNGLNDELVATVVGFNRVVGCVPSISAGVYDPGHIIRTDPMTTHCFSVGELSGVITPRVREAVEALKVIGPTEATTNIWGARWAKLVVNCMNNALSGLIGKEESSLAEVEQQRATAIKALLACETVQVGEALGVAVEPLVIGGITTEEFGRATSDDTIMALGQRIRAASATRRLSAQQVERLGAPGRPSLLQDMIKGRRTEVEHLNGCVVKKGAEAGVPTPMNSAIVHLVLELQEGRIKAGSANISKLWGKLAG